MNRLQSSLCLSNTQFHTRATTYRKFISLFTCFFFFSTSFTYAIYPPTLSMISHYHIWIDHRLEIKSILKQYFRAHLSHRTHDAMELICHHKFSSGLAGSLICLYLLLKFMLYLFQSTMESLCLPIENKCFIRNIFLFIESAGM